MRACVACPQQTFDGAVAAFGPQAVVLCCGVDSLGADPLGTFNLSSQGVAAAVRHAAGELKV